MPEGRAGARGTMTQGTRTRGTMTRETIRRTWAAAAVVAVVLAVTSMTAGAQNGGTPASETEPAECSDTTSTITGTANPDQAKTYHLFPFDVPKGTARIEIGYEWTNVDDGVIDIGVYDNRGTTGPEAFRSWAGSRQGRLDDGTAPLVIAPDRNERTVIARSVEPGTWHVELGYAAVDRPLEWRVELRCVPGDQVPPPTPDPVDPNVVVKDEAGWYAGDFHLHGYHSSTDGPDPDEMVAKAKAAGLDIIPVTEYVTDAHWERLGPAQRDHPDVLIWPGREVITYFGHMIVLNETPHAVDYRVGHDGLTANDLASAATDDGGIVQLAHPTIFPADVFGSLCRGCFTENVDQLDMSNITSIEVVTEGSIAELGGNDVPNPFVRTAVELWERKLREGHRLTAVSGSDDKSGDNYGKTQTMVYADQLSRPAVDLAIRQGHAYVRGLGNDSPTMELNAVAADGTEAIFGDTLVTPTASLTYDVTGGNGQVLAIRRNGTEVTRVPITSDDFTHTVNARPHRRRGSARHVLGRRSARHDPVPGRRDPDRDRQPGVPGRLRQSRTDAAFVREGADPRIGDRARRSVDRRHVLRRRDERRPLDRGRCRRPGGRGGGCFRDRPAPRRPTAAPTPVRRDLTNRDRRYNAAGTVAVSHRRPPDATTRREHMENEAAIEARRESSRAAGRTARDAMPRAELGRWAPTLRDHDPLVTIESQNAIRLAALASLRHERMSVSAWNFYRGAAAVMARDLGARGGDTGLTVQLCGDAHVLNFGLWATPERNLAFDLRDFDETLPGPFEWDVARLVASIHVLARDSGLDAATAERAVAACLASYRQRMGRYAEAKQLDIWYDRIDVEEFVSVFKAKDRELATRHISRKARRRSNRGTVAKITEQVDGELRITIDEPVRVRLDADEVAFVEHIFDGYHDSLQEDRRHLLDRFTLVDMVRQVVGVGSVGMRVYLLLLEGRDGRDPLFLQIKQAGPSAYEDVRGESSMPTTDSGW